MTNIEPVLQSIVRLLYELASREDSRIVNMEPEEVVTLNKVMLQSWDLYKDELIKQRETLQAQREQFLKENASAFEDWQRGRSS